MGQKYQIDAVLSEGLRRLYYEFPVELADYDINDNWSRISKEGGNDILMDIANLAREQNLLSILPLALHCCSSEEYSDAIAKGIKREDQTVATLSPVNERAVWAASHPLLRIQTTTTYAWLLAFRSDDSCADEDDCENARAHIARRSFFPVSTQHDCLSPWDEDWEEDLCSACVSKAQTIHSAGRQSYWNQLPSIFDLPDWEELKKDRLLSTMCVVSGLSFSLSLLTKGDSVYLDDPKSRPINAPCKFFEFFFLFHSECTLMGDRI